MIYSLYPLLKVVSGISLHPEGAIAAPKTAKKDIIPLQEQYNQSHQQN